MQVQAFFVIFLINAFQSLENELVRHECLRLVSMSTWVRPRGMSGSGSRRDRWLHANSTERPWARGAGTAALPAGWTARAGAEQVHQAAQNVEGTAEAERGHVCTTLPAGGTRALVPLARCRNAPLVLTHACVHALWRTPPRDKDKLQLYRTFLSRLLQRFFSVLDLVPAEGDIPPHVVRYVKSRRRRRATNHDCGWS